MKSTHLALATLALLASACTSADSAGTTGAGGGAVDSLPPPPKSEGFQVGMKVTAPGGTEVWKCNVTDLPNPGFFAANHVESLQSANIHHMDVMALVFTDVDLELGEYDCAGLYEQYPALMEKGLIIYAAQQEKQEILLPEGVVASLPPKLRIMQEVHFVNTSEEAVEVFSKVNIYEYPQEKVVDTIWGGAVRDTNLNIPAKGKHTEWTRCVMNEDVDLLFLSSHTHQLGRKVTIKHFDGAKVGDELYTNTDWHSPFLMSLTAKPLHVAKGTGFEFACDFENNTNAEVHWGFAASDEMCQIALVFTPGEASRECQVVATSDGATE